MKYKLKYSPNAADKLRNIKKRITSAYGKTVAARVLAKLLKELRVLEDYPEKGPSVEAYLGIPTSYRFLHIEQVYVFYRIEYDTVFVVEIFNEKEDFMMKMFGINTRTSDSIEFWGE